MASPNGDLRENPQYLVLTRWKQPCIEFGALLNAGMILKTHPAVGTFRETPLRNSYICQAVRRLTPLAHHTPLEWHT